MRTGSRRRREVIHWNKSASQPVGRRRTGPRLIPAALVAGLCMALAGPALAAGKTPTVTSLIPKHATHAGGTSVTITGSNFTGTTAVRFGGINAASFTVNSNTMITAVSPPGGEGTSVQVGVTTPAGGSASTPADFFFYMKGCQEGHAPAVTSVEPHSGPAETRVIIKGERFFEGVCTPPEGFSVERVLFGFKEATSFKRIKEGELEAFSPPGTGTVDVTVESFIGQSPVTPSDQFTGPGPAIYHWYRNATKLAEGTVVPIVMFGGKVNLTMQNGLGGPNCRTVLGGTIENPVGGGAGVGRTNSMTFYECKASTCEAEVKAKTGLEGRFRATTENNPAATQEPAFPGWSDSLEESEVAGVSSVREKIGEPWATFKTPSPPGMVRETEICEVAPTKEAVATAISEGELKPEIGAAKSGNLNGVTAAKPSQVKFSGASTESMASELAGETTYTGSLKYLGYNEQELITVKP
jgi:hypothetical protein